MTSKPLQVLFVGGTGTISASCARSAVARGMDVTVLNRARSELRPLPPEVERLIGDVREPSSLKAAIGGRDFDVVVNFLCYSADDARSALEMFRGHTGHYLHISTAMVYQKPPRGMPYRESTERREPLLEVRPRQDSRRGCADRGVRVGVLSCHDRATIAHLRRSSAACAWGLDRHRPD